eukprot:TRINITY_DN6815_c0_g1_i4.p1 TRINITY_DN6815_c0_g1~~TRINITY_DN6815_c0_g1_i4.p1  ORF type:complete len:442 (+),score=109.50 TRINITY_DN6815_c0_g1_i4:58-1383(+)
MTSNTAALKLADDRDVAAIVIPHPTVPGKQVYTFDVDGHSHQLVTEETVESIATKDLRVALAGQYVKGEDAVEATTIAGVFSTAMLAPADAISDAVGKPDEFMPWGSIVHLNNVSRGCQATSTNVKVVYRAKIKLHGTNAGVQLHRDGRVLAQSRKRVLSAKTDNAGFHAWVTEQPEPWQALRNAIEEETGHASVVVYGEWCGPGVQKDDAICMTPSKQFCIFAVALPIVNDQGHFHRFGLVKMINEPEVLYRLVASSGLRNVHVLPWHTEPLTIAYGSFDADNSPAVDTINAVVEQVGDKDPWVAATFGVEGPGEGIVLTPLSIDDKPVVYQHEYLRFGFKAKSEGHGVKKGKAAALDTAVSASATAFADQFVTPARCEQGLTEAGCMDREGKKFGKFLGWMLKDIEKEGQDELQASELTFKQVKPAIINACKQFYFMPA